MRRRLRIRINRRDRQYVAAFAVMMIIVYSGIAYGILTPPRPDSFFSTWILGAEGMAADYYPNGNSDLRIGQEVKWTLGVYNHIGSLQYVVLRVKLLNATIVSPNQTLGTSTPVTSILEFARVLLDNETWSIPFTWRIINMTQIDDSVVITRLSLNNNTLSGEFASAVHGINFRFIFELWFYDGTAQELAFSWVVAGDRHSAWTQIWFNVTMVG